MIRVSRTHVSLTAKLTRAEIVPSLQGPARPVIKLTLSAPEGSLVTEVPLSHDFVVGQEYAVLIVDPGTVLRTVEAPQPQEAA